MLGNVIGGIQSGFQDMFEQIGEKLNEFPREAGTEAWGQMKGQKSQTQTQGQGQGQPNNTGNPQGDQDYQKYLNDLYGVSPLNPQQESMKKAQEGKMKIRRYQQIQQEIQRFRAERSRLRSAAEINAEKGTKAARTQEEKQELWMEQQKRAEEEKKKRDSVVAPGGKGQRMGERQSAVG